MKKLSNTKSARKPNLVLSKTTIKYLTVHSSLRAGRSPISPSYVTCATVCGKQCVE